MTKNCDKCNKSKKNKSSSSSSSSSSSECNEACTLINLDCEILKYKLNNDNIPFICNNSVPCLLKGYIKMIGNVKGMRYLVSKSNNDLDSDLDVSGILETSEINNYFNELPAYYFNNKRYNIRLTIVKTDGTVYYDNLFGINKSQADSMNNHNTRLEIQKASNTKWGSMERTSSTDDIRYRYFAIWIPECLQNGFNNVLCFRFAIKVDVLGNFIYEP